MAVLSIVLTVLLTAGVLGFALLPLWRRTGASQSGLNCTGAPPGSSSYATSRAELLTRRDALYATLQDAEFDREMGKLGDADYEVLRARTVREAASVLRKLDRITPEAEAALDRDIEQAVTRLRSNSPGQGWTALPPSVVEAVETEVAALVKHAGTAAQAGKLVCPNCGQAYCAGDAFCVHCGTDLIPGTRGADR